MMELQEECGRTLPIMTINSPSATNGKRIATRKKTTNRQALNTKEFENLHLDITSHPEILEYRIKWWGTAGWSQWYVPGVGDVDTKTNTDGTPRRMWSYFADHEHEFKTCLKWIQPPSDNGCKTQITERQPLISKEFENLHLDISAHPEILLYRIKWSNGVWSQYYIPGLGDVDTKVNTDGTPRRMWSYFADHVHEITTCVKKSDRIR